MSTLRENVGRMLLVGFEGLRAPDYILEWLADGRIGGVVFFTRNVDSPAQVAERMCSGGKSGKFLRLESR
jgi:beta-N-acetylhexosaminidase